MVDTSKAEPNNTTILRVMAQIIDECETYLAKERGLDWVYQDKAQHQLEELLMRWYLRGIAAGQASQGD
jgi:hypothetical protein